MNMAGRLVMLINSLEGGGAEKVFAALASHLAQSCAWDLRLVTLDDRHDAHTVSSAIPRTRLDCDGSFRRSITETRRLISDWQPEAVLSFLTRSNCAAILSRQANGPRCIISERVNTSSHLGTGAKSMMLKSAVRLLYPRADAVIAVSEGVASGLLTRFGVPARRLTTIQNPVFVNQLKMHGSESPGISLPTDFFVAMGRLVPNKDVETLLRSFAAHANKKRELVLLGDGPERYRLEALAKALGIGDRVRMPGYLANPYAVLARATAYISASHSEGFPNALVEALALGRAVISTDCRSGPAEILADNATGQTTKVSRARWGLLVPVGDTAALTGAMDLLDDPALRAAYQGRAEGRARAYDPEKIFARYDAVLRSPAFSSPPTRSATAPRLIQR